MTRPAIRATVAAFLVAFGGLAACDREARRFTEAPPTATAYGAVVLNEELQPGVRTPDVDIHSPYEENAWAVSEGKRLYNMWNCVGCHAQGGGGMGPPLMDDEWVYGSDAENIVATIVEGRPNGMPSFRGRISNQQLWQLAAYVRSMSGLLPKDVRPGRDDNMQMKVDEQRTDRRTPTSAASRVVPKTSEIP